MEQNIFEIPKLESFKVFMQFLLFLYLLWNVSFQNNL